MNQDNESSGFSHTPGRTVSQIDVARWIDDNLAQRRAWLATCEREVASFDLMEHGESFASRWREALAEAQHRFLVASALADLLSDRDEWREQHENLLSVRQSDLAVLTAKARGEQPCAQPPSSPPEEPFK